MNETAWNAETNAGSLHPQNQQRRNSGERGIRARVMVKRRVKGAKTRGPRLEYQGVQEPSDGAPGGTDGCEERGILSDAILS